VFDVACFVSSCAHLVVYVGFLYVIKCSRYASLFFSESHILFLLFTSLAFHIGLLVSSRTYSGLFIYLFLVFFFFFSCLHWFSICDSLWEVGRDSLCRPRLVLHMCIPNSLPLPHAGMAAGSLRAIGCSCPSLSVFHSSSSSLSHQLLGTFSEFFISCVLFFQFWNFHWVSVLSLSPAGVPDLLQWDFHSLIGTSSHPCHSWESCSKPGGPCLGYTVAWFPQCLMWPAFLIASWMVSSSVVGILDSFSLLERHSEGCSSQLPFQGYVTPVKTHSSWLPLSDSPSQGYWAFSMGLCWQNHRQLGKAVI
jgi:hypothetical protein